MDAILIINSESTDDYLRIFSYFEALYDRLKPRPELEKNLTAVEIIAGIYDAKRNGSDTSCPIKSNNIYYCPSSSLNF